MTENVSHDEDLTLEEADTEDVSGGKSAGTWEEVACTSEGTEYRNSKTGKTKLVRPGTH